MPPLLKKSLVGLAVVAIAIQFVPISRNTSAAPPGPDDITVLHPTSPGIKSTLATSCYDCHSDNTRYPWYSKIQPVAWWLQHHIDEGRHKLNLSEFGKYPATQARRKLKGIIHELKDHDMPLESYTLIHRDAILSDTETAALTDWANQILAGIPDPAAH